MDEQEERLYEKLRERFRYGHAVEDIPLCIWQLTAGVNYRDAQDTLEKAIGDALGSR